MILVVRVPTGSPSLQQVLDYRRTSIRRGDTLKVGTSGCMAVGGGLFEKGIQRSTLVVMMLLLMMLPSIQRSSFSLRIWLVGKGLFDFGRMIDKVKTLFVVALGFSSALLGLSSLVHLGSLALNKYSVGIRPLIGDSLLELHGNSRGWFVCG